MKMKKLLCLLVNLLVSCCFSFLHYIIMEYKIRLIEELLDLHERIVKLFMFINTHEDPEEILYEQLNIMEHYRRILVKRIHKEMGINYEED